MEGGSKGWINPLLPVLLQIASRLGRSVWPFVWPGRTSVAKEAAEVDFRVLLPERIESKVCQDNGITCGCCLDSLG